MGDLKYVYYVNDYYMAWEQNAWNQVRFEKPRLTDVGLMRLGPTSEYVLEREWLKRAEARFTDVLAAASDEAFERKRNDEQTFSRRFGVPFKCVPSLSALDRALDPDAFRVNKLCELMYTVEDPGALAGAINSVLGDALSTKIDENEPLFEGHIILPAIIKSFAKSNDCVAAFMGALQVHMGEAYPSELRESDVVEQKPDSVLAVIVDSNLRRGEGDPYAVNMDMVKPILRGKNIPVVFVSNELDRPEGVRLAHCFSTRLNDHRSDWVREWLSENGIAPSSRVEITDQVLANLQNLPLLDAERVRLAENVERVAGLFESDTETILNAHIYDKDYNEIPAFSDEVRAKYGALKQTVIALSNDVNNTTTYVSPSLIQQAQQLSEDVSSLLELIAEQWKHQVIPVLQERAWRITLSRAEDVEQLSPEKQKEWAGIVQKTLGTQRVNPREAIAVFGERALDDWDAALRTSTHQTEGRSPKHPHVEHGTFYAESTLQHDLTTALARMFYHIEGFLDTIHTIAQRAKESGKGPGGGGGGPTL